MKPKSLLLSAFFSLVLPCLAFAQDCDPGDPAGCGVYDTPIDSWLIVLLTAGALYGYLKYRKAGRIAVK